MGQHELLLEALKNGGMPSQFRADHFKRHNAIHFAIPRAVNRTHASLAKELQYFVSASEYGARTQDRFAVQFGRVTRPPAGRGGSFGKSRSIQVHFN